MRDSQKLSEIFFSLNESGQQSLLDYALFLTQQHKKDQTEFPEPELIQREEGETVIAAIKRLKKSYAMLNMDKLLNETSTFTAQYMLQGRDVDEVIDDLEKTFVKHYDKQKEDYES